MYLPYPTIEESVNSLHGPLLFRINQIIGFELESQYEYSKLGRCWLYHGYQLAEYALLAIERADTISVNFNKDWWSRNKDKTGKWRFPPSFFMKYQKKDTGLPPWATDPRVHEYHKAYTKNTSLPLQFTSEMELVAKQRLDTSLRKIRSQVKRENLTRTTK